MLPDEHTVRKKVSSIYAIQLFSVEEHTGKIGDVKGFPRSENP